MIFNMVGGGVSAEDGNDIQYPISQLPTENKLYAESAIQDIAVAIQTQSGSQDKYTVSEMADAIRSIATGLHATRVYIYTAEYTKV